METLERACGLKLMRAFRSTEPGANVLETVRTGRTAGFTLFRSLNVESRSQVRRLTSALQEAAAASGQPPLLIAADQEGGQLMAIGDATPFPGNMALGATGSIELARRAGAALGRELAAVGINVNYAPVCDVNNNPQNPAVGVRSFGEDPATVTRLCVAMVEGMQAEGVAATAKHFPGHGDTSEDPHHGLPVVYHTRERLGRVELPPFAAAIEAGVCLVMTAHLALPNLNDGVALPSTLSPALLDGLLREELGFRGVIISDAMDMGAVDQGRVGLIVDAIAAVAAGVDLLLLIDRAEEVYTALRSAAQRGLLAPDKITASAERVLALKRWLTNRAQPPLDVVGCAEHRDLAAEIAARSITLVRDETGLLPLRLPPTACLAAVVPRPADLTPADTSSYITCRLADALRKHHAAVDEFIVPPVLSDADVADLRQALRGYDVVIAGTINASTQPGQAALVNALLETGVPTAAVALRLPYDLQAYPDAPTYLCTYSILEPSMEALAAALWGDIPFRGQLPVSIPGIYPIGHGEVS